MRKYRKELWVVVGVVSAVLTFMIGAAIGSHMSEVRKQKIERFLVTHEGQPVTTNVPGVYFYPMRVVYSQGGHLHSLWGMIEVEVPGKPIKTESIQQSSGDSVDQRLWVITYRREPGAILTTRIVDPRQIQADILGVLVRINSECRAQISVRPTND